MDISMNELRIVESELGIELSVLIESIEKALLRVYEDKPGAVPGARVEFNQTTGQVTVWAPEIDEEGNAIGEFDDTPRDFARAATAKARSIIAQQLREAENKRVLGNFQGKKGEIVSGVVESSASQSSESRDLFIELGDNKGILRAEEQVPTEHFRHGDLIRALVLDVSVVNRGASIRLSRSHPDFVRKLFETEVPEIAKGIVEIVALAREAGHRSKLAVWSSDPNVAAKGASIGHNAQRVRAVTQELQGEKIDVVEYDDDPALFIAAALSPAKVLRVHILDRDARQALAVVPDDQASLAIGKEAQNVRLAAKLTEWNIDIRKESEVADRSFED